MDSGNASSAWRTAYGTAGADAERAGLGKIVLASLVGTTIEFYDFYIFGTAAALVFGPMFFPKSAPETQALNAYLTFGVAFLARPGLFSVWGISATAWGESRRWLRPC